MTAKVFPLAASLFVFTFLPRLAFFFTITVQEIAQTVQQPRQLDCLERNVIDDDTWSKFATSQIVFKASIVAKSAKDKDDSSHQVTFRVETIFKGAKDLGLVKHVRIKFFNPDADVVIDQAKTGCRIGSRFRSRSDYLVYVVKSGTKKFSAFARPDMWSKKVDKIVRKFQNCHNCAQLPKLKKLYFSTGSGTQRRTFSTIPSPTESQSRDVQLGDRVNLRCTFKKSLPRPNFVWLKDGTRISVSSEMLESEEEDESEIVGSASGADSEKIRILSSRKRTTLTINNFGPDDVGSYTCSGLSVTGNASADFRIRVDKNDVRKIAKKVSKPWWEKENLTSECPVPGFCLNRGQCIFYKSIGEMVCVCGEDFSGKRCELKSRPKLENPLKSQNEESFCDFYKC